MKKNKIILSALSFFLLTGFWKCSSDRDKQAEKISSNACLAVVYSMYNNFSGLAQTLPDGDQYPSAISKQIDELIKSAQTKAKEINPTQEPGNKDVNALLIQVREQIEKLEPTYWQECMSESKKAYTICLGRDDYDLNNPNCPEARPVGENLALKYSPLAKKIAENTIKEKDKLIEKSMNR